MEHAKGAPPLRESQQRLRALITAPDGADAAARDEAEGLLQGDAQRPVPARLAIYAYAWFERLRRQEHGEAHFIYLRRNDGLIGGITLSNIRRGASQCGELGYWIGKPYIGQRLMTDALRVMTAHCFNELKLHRLEAACLPENTPSRRLLAQAGFRSEGILREYLKIDGVWRDHQLYARLASDPISSGVA